MALYHGVNYKFVIKGVAANPAYAKRKNRVCRFGLTTRHSVGLHLSVTSQ
ncbi:hypothetical protein CEPID_12705 [Corynebacterium epidermidicanis]|uniref:Uncharacterized protein n=1 Tax=Corynebacterium epidermidicanis TaxID=1050174 RepID=A0A0G3GXU9_9CORY|nr:hypothetical protein CEPID_12705 [Corynebacterium epidermidicanis]